MWIYIKLFLALLLVVLPFLFAYLRPKEDSTSIWRNFFTLIGSRLPMLRKIGQKILNILKRFYNGMKRFDSFRRFFTLIVVMVMLLYQFIDFSASTLIASMIQGSSGDARTLNIIINQYGPMMTSPQATLLAAFITLPFFFFGTTDKLMTKVRDKKKLYFFSGVITLVFILASPRYYIVGELLTIILLAVSVYPKKEYPETPKGRKGLTKLRRMNPLKNVA